MRFTLAFLAFATAALAAPLPQISLSGPLGSISWGGIGRGGEISGPLGSASTEGIFNGGGGSVEGPLGSLSWGRGGRDDDD